MYFDVGLIHIVIRSSLFLLQEMQVMTILYNGIDDNFDLIRMEKILN